MRYRRREMILSERARPPSDDTNHRDNTGERLYIGARNRITWAQGLLRVMVVQQIQRGTVVRIAREAREFGVFQPAP